VIAQAVCSMTRATARRRRRVWPPVPPAMKQAPAATALPVSRRSATVRAGSSTRQANVRLRLRHVSNLARPAPSPTHAATDSVASRQSVIVPADSLMPTAIARLPTHRVSAVGLLAGAMTIAVPGSCARRPSARRLKRWYVAHWAKPAKRMSIAVRNQADTVSMAPAAAML
jgi:hypothetical protein